VAAAYAARSDVQRRITANSRRTVIECVTSTPAKYPSEFIRNARKFR
jgi:hypothetical protein